MNSMCVSHNVFCFALSFTIVCWSFFRRMPCLPGVAIQHRQASRGRPQWAWGAPRGQPGEVFHSYGGGVLDGQSEDAEVVVGAAHFLLSGKESLGNFQQSTTKISVFFCGKLSEINFRQPSTKMEKQISSGTVSKISIANHKYVWRISSRGMKVLEISTNQQQKYPFFSVEKYTKYEINFHQPSTEMFFFSSGKFFKNSNIANNKKCVDLGYTPTGLKPRVLSCAFALRTFLMVVFLFCDNEWVWVCMS